MPQSPGTRRRSPASRSQQRSQGRRGGGRRREQRRDPLPRAHHEAPGHLDSDEYPAPAPPAPERRSGLVRRALTSNVTITLVAALALGGGVVYLDFDGLSSKLGFGENKPPKGAAAGMSLNDMLAMAQSSDMDPIAADAIATAKKRAYEQHQKELKALKEKAKRDAKAKAKLEAEQERERLAKMNPSAAQNQAYGKKMSAAKGWGRCWSSLKTLWEHESGWNERATNPSSGAYGIPQALPGSKLASAGADWRTSSPTQIAWGLGYIKARYRDPCGAWSWWQAHNWY
jgi:hypothetical protein